MVSRSKNITDYTKLGGKLNDDNTLYVFDDVIVKNRSGKQIHWQIKVGMIKGDNVNDLLKIEEDWFNAKYEYQEDYYGYIIVDKWVGDGDTHNVTPTIIKKGKNLGKTNSTNTFTQALSEAYSLRLKHIDRNAKNKEHGGVELFPPMLAKKRSDVEVFTDIDVDFTEVCYQQRKFDGVRAVMTLNNDKTGVIIYSRQLKEYLQFDHLREDAHQFLVDAEAICGEKVYIDGELYKHGEILQDISKAARKKNSKQGILLEYHCYDCFIPTKKELMYSERKEILDELFDYSENYKWIKGVETWQPKNESEVMENHKKCLEDNYEGSMIRKDKPYEYSYKGYHCNILLKIKPKLDEEFMISGFFAADRGKTDGCLMWKCKIVSDDGVVKEFNVTPMGTHENRKQLYLELQKVEKNGKTVFENKYLNKPLTIKFDDYSKDGVPVRGNAVAIRDYE